MKQASIWAALLALSACGGETGMNDGYLNNANPATGGGMGGAPAQVGGGAPAMAPPNMMPPNMVPPSMNAGMGGTTSVPPQGGMSGGGMGGAMVMAGSGSAGEMMMGGAGGMMGGSGGSSMAGSGGTMSGGNTPGTVTVEFTTVSYGGEYAPLNYGAVWFETPGGEFIKTAKRWAGTTHASDLVAWTEASGGWGSIFGGGNTADMMDAMSSATIRTHQKHTVMWSMKNAMGTLVPDGDYVAVVEMSESRARDQAGPLLHIPFKKGPMAQTVEQPDMASFTGIVLRYEP